MVEKRYKIIISNHNIYKEIELSSDAKQVKIGTGIECDVRLRRELFFGAIDLVFIKNGEAWSVLCSDNLYLTTGDIRKLMTKKLVHGDSVQVKYQTSDNLVFVIDFMIDFNDGKTKYERCIDVSKNSYIHLGADNSNNIVLQSPYVKTDTVVLRRENRCFSVEIKNSTYGVYINGKKAQNGDLIKNLDFLAISDFFFYHKNGELWTSIREDMVINGLAYEDRPIPVLYPKFNRNTRLKTIVCEDGIEVLDPPERPQKPKNNLFTRLVPSLGMLMVSGVMAFMGGAMVIMSAVSGVMAIVTSIITMRTNKKEFEKKSNERIEKYTTYIENKRTEIEDIRSKEKQALNEIYISQEEQLKRFNDFSPALFERTSADEDFLCVKLGDGLIEAKRKINYKKQERLEVEDELQLIPEQLSEEYKYVHSAPVICDLKNVNAIGIVGKELYRFDLLKNIIIDVIARQYFADVRMLFVAEEKHAEKVKWLRMLPHVYDEQIKLRTIVTDDESKNIVFEYLYKELSQRESAKAYENHILVFFYDEYGFKNHPISKFVKKAKQLGVTFIFMGDVISEIPLGCGEIISLGESGTGCLINTFDKNNFVNFTYSHMDDSTAKKVVDLMAPIYCEEISLEGSLTKNISMFQLLNILSVDDIDLEKRWKSSIVYKSMAAPIGISKSGVTYLDLHDKAHGPHGLVAGTTGSGKSEILQTYILSMSTLFHPYEVAFVIIDFKGGGMVNQFKELPHLLGAITNIDGKEIDRSLKSIKAELQKRQRLFAEAEVNHIDKYIRKYKDGEVTCPLPHLILIVDEFAELKAEQPEFMKELISAARIGRSLGVHLILATQKPSGQVNEQIWSNSRFKLCLKVQSKEDSNEVLKSPLAAEIKEPGRAYLQVGNNEIFELFQSAYSGAPERMDDSTVKEFTINSLTVCGKRTPVYVQKRKKVEETETTQLDAIVSYITEYCKGIALEKLPNICLPSLSDYITVPEISGDYTLRTIPLGIYDDPDSQYQGYAMFNLCDDNTIIIGASQTGKTNLIQSIIRMVANKFSPENAVFYIADFGTMYLKNFEKLNHVGGVVTISENERMKNLIKLLTQEVQNRKSKFLGYGLSSFAAYCEAGYHDLPHIFFIIDNFSAFKEVYADSYEDQFIYLTREGIACGISIIITNSVATGMGYRYMSNFANRIALNCNDSNDYMNIFDRCRIRPKDVPGRILCEFNKEIYEAQTFIAFEGEKEYERSNAVKKYIDKLNKKYPDKRAKQIPCVPDVLTFEYMEQNYSSESEGYKYPIGLDYATVEVVNLDFKETNELCIIGKKAEEKIAATKRLLASIRYNALCKPVGLYIIDGVERNLKAEADWGYVENYTIDYSELGSIFDEIMPEMEIRYQYLMDGKTEQLAQCKQIVILINNKDAIEYISSTKDIMTMYLRFVKQFKALKIAFVFSDIEDVAVAYNSPELLKRFKETRKLLITSKLQEFKYCDLPMGATRNFKNVNVGDCFLMDGTELLRIKLAEEG